jgi:hypothetical protein
MTVGPETAAPIIGRIWVFTTDPYRWRSFRPKTQDCHAMQSREFSANVLVSVF